MYINHLNLIKVFYTQSGGTDLSGYDVGAGNNVLAPIDEDYDDMDLGDIKELERDHGVNFDDDYNYMQHMKVHQRLIQLTIVIIWNIEKV